MKKHFAYFFLAIFCVVNICVWFFVYRSHTGQLHVSFLHTNGASAVLVTSPTGNHILIDTGSDVSILTELGKSMSFYDHTINSIITTEPDNSHIGALPLVFSRYSIGAYASKNAGVDTAVYRTSMNEIRDNHIPTYLISQGDHIDIGGGAYILVLCAENNSNEPLVLELVYKKSQMIFADDMTLDMQSRLASSFHTTFENNLVIFSSSTPILPSFVSPFGSSHIFRIHFSGSESENFISDGNLFSKE